MVLIFDHPLFLCYNITMPHPTKMDEIKKGALFKSLATKSIVQVGYQFEFDKHYKSTSGLRNAVYKIYNEVKNEPEKFAISQDTVDLVASALSGRAIAPVTNNEKTLREQQEDADNLPFAELAQAGRNKALKLLHKKIDRVSNSRKKIDAMSMGEMAKVFGIMFDKSQIIRGEATEHVKILSKNVDDTMTAEERLNYVLKLREINNEEKEIKRNK